MMSRPSRLLDGERRSWRPREKGHEPGHEVCVKYRGKTAETGRPIITSRRYFGICRTDLDTFGTGSPG
jgi:hypothetical protein